MRYIKMFNESIDKEKGVTLKISLSVPVFSEKWTTFFGCKKYKSDEDGKYKVIGGCDELELKYYDIVWKKYEGVEMPWRDMRNGRFSGPSGGGCRPEFKIYPRDLINSLEHFKNGSFVTKFKKGLGKMYYSEKKGEIDPFPNKEEISEMELEFQSSEDAFDWLTD